MSFLVYSARCRAWICSASACSREASAERRAYRALCLRRNAPGHSPDPIQSLWQERGALLPVDSAPAPSCRDRTALPCNVDWPLSRRENATPRQQGLSATSARYDVALSRLASALKRLRFDNSAAFPNGDHAVGRHTWYLFLCAIWPANVQVGLLSESQAKVQSQIVH